MFVITGYKRVMVKRIKEFEEVSVLALRLM